MKLLKKIFLVIVFQLSILTLYSQDVNKIVVEKDTIFGYDDTGALVDSMICDTACYLPDSAGDFQEVDTLIIEPGSQLYVKSNGPADSWTNQLIVEDFLEIMPNAKMESVADSILLGVKGTQFINDAGKDSVVNLNLVLHGGPLTITGNYPTKLNNLEATFNGRHIYLDTTLTVEKQLLNGFETSIFLQGETLILKDSAYFADLTTNNNTENYSFVVPDSNKGGQVIRKVSSYNTAKTDTIPFGMIPENNMGTWAQLKLDTVITLGVDPSITYQYIPEQHMDIPSATTSYLNNYLQVQGTDINDLKYELALGYRNENVTGNSLSLVNAFYANHWYSSGSVHHNTQLVQLDGLTKWGELTAIGGPTAKTYTPSKNSTGVGLDSVVEITFEENVDSLNFNDISIYDQSNNQVGGLHFNWDSVSNKITIHHDSLTKLQETYTVSIPAGIVWNSDSIVNPDIHWSFTTIMPPQVDSLIPANNEISVAVDKTVSIIFGQDVDSVNFSNIKLQSSKEGNVTINNMDLVTAERTIHIHHDNFKEADTITVIIPDSIVVNQDGFGNEYTEWTFSTEYIIGKGVLSSEMTAVQIYPNPSNGKFYIDADLDLPYTIKICDIHGTVIAEKVVNKENKPINLPEKIKEGMYLIKLKCKDQKIVRQLIIE